MASPSEIFRVVGKVVLEGQDAVEKALDSVSKKADTVDSAFKRGLGGLDKNVPRNVTKPLDDAIDGTSRKMGDFERGSGTFTNLLKSGFGIGVGMKAFEVATDVFGRFGSAIKDSVFGMNSTLQTSQLQFETLMGSADQAQKQVAFLFDFAKKTPFETGPIIEASKLLQTFGGTALNTEGNLTLIGDAAAATGAPIEELGMWTGRLYASLQAGKPFGDAASRLGELAVLTPQARLEMEKMQAEGKSANEIFAYFQKTLGNFSGAMEKQAGTWQGLTGTFSDTINILSAKAMKPFFDLASKGLGQLNEILGSDAFGKGAEKVATTIAGGIQRAVDGATAAVGGFGPKIISAFGIAKDAVTTFSQALSGNWTDAPGIMGIHRVVGTIATVIRDDVIPTVTKLIELFQSGFDKIAPVLSGIATNIKDNFNPSMLLTPLIGVFSLLFGNMSSIGNQIKELFLTSILPAIATFATQVGPYLTQAANFFTEILLPSINSLKQTVADAFSNVILPAIISFVEAVIPSLTQFAGWFAGEAVARIVAFGTDIAGLFSQTVMPAILTFLNTVMPLLQQFGNWFAATAVPQIQEFAAAFMQAFDEIEPKLMAALQTIVADLTTVFGGIVTFIQAHGDTIKAYLTLAWNQISGTIGGVLEIIENVIKLALDLISGNWQGAWDDILGIFKGVWDTITSILSPAITIIQAIINAFTTFVGNIFSALGTTTNAIWTAISTTIQTAMTAIQAFLTPILNAIQTIWSTTWTAIQVVADTVWRAIETIVRVEMALVQTIMEPILNAIQNTWNTIWTAIQETAQTVWNFINQNIVTPIFTAIQTFINNTLTAIQTTWNTIWSAVETTLNTTWNNIQTALTTVWNTISSLATTTWNAIKEAVTGPINEAKTTLDGVWDTIESKATGVWNNIKKVISDSGTDVKNALMWPFEQMRDTVEGVMKAAGTKLLAPLQTALNGFGDFVNGVRGAINSISSKLGLGDIIRDTWSGAQIRQLRLGTESWRGGKAILGEHGVEAARYPDGTVRMFRAAQLIDLPAGTKIYNPHETRTLVKDNPNINVYDGFANTLTYGGAVYDKYGKGGAWGAITGIADKVKGLTGTALDFAKGIVSKGAEKVVSELIDKLPVPNFPGDLSNMPGKAVGIIKDKVIESIKELAKIVADNAPSDTATSDPSTWGEPGTINGVSGTHIMEVAQRTAGGILGYCEKWVGDVMARAGVRYYRASDAFAHSQMQATTPGTGPLGAPIFTGFGTPGDVSISMGNGMGFGTEGGRGTSIGAGPFKPYAGARFTLNPAANGMVVDRPTAILAGETVGAQREIVTPEALMAQIVRNELNRSNSTDSGFNVIIQVTADDTAKGYEAGRAAGKGFKDTMLQYGFNR